MQWMDSGGNTSAVPGFCRAVFSGQAVDHHFNSSRWELDLQEPEFHEFGATRTAGKSLSAGEKDNTRNSMDGMHDGVQPACRNGFVRLKKRGVSWVPLRRRKWGLAGHTSIAGLRREQAGNSN